MGCDLCDYLDNCAPWQIRLSEITNYCEEQKIDLLTYRFSEGEDMWYEMSYNNYCEDCLDTKETEWDLLVKESAY